MRKHLLAAIILCAGVMPAHPQSDDPGSSAICLAWKSAHISLKDSTKYSRELREFLLHPLEYLKKLDDLPTAETIDAAWKGTGEKGNGWATDFQPVAPTTGTGLTQSVVLEGVTQFLIARAEEEIQASFVDDLKKKLSENTLITNLFPRTVDVLNHITIEGFQTLLSAFRSALREDFRNIPYTLCDPSVASNLKLNQKERSLLMVLLEAKRISEGKDPLVSLAQLRTLPEGSLGENPGQRAISAFVRLAGYLAFESSCGRAKLSNNLSLSEALGTSQGKKYFVVLLARELHAANVPFDPVEWNDPGVVEKLAGASASLSSAVTVFQTSNTTQNNSSSTQNNATTKYISLSRAVIDIAHGLSGVSHSFGIDPSLLQSLGDVIEVENALVTQDYSKAVILIIRTAVVLSLPNDSNELTVRLLVFCANVASVETADDMNKALEALADPVGSFRAKREGKTHWTLNAYLGAGAGWEAPSGQPMGTGLFYLSLATPVGFEYTFYHDSHCVISTVGVLIAPLDFGTLVNYRIGSPATVNTGTSAQSTGVSTTPNATFAQVFAPGAYVVLGITGRSPISSGFGIQYLPRLRSANGSDIDIWHVGLFVGIDMTLLRF